MRDVCRGWLQARACATMARGAFVLNVPRLVGSSFRACLLAFEVGGGWGGIGCCTHHPAVLYLIGALAWAGSHRMCAACSGRMFRSQTGVPCSGPAPSISLRPVADVRADRPAPYACPHIVPGALLFDNAFVLIREISAPGLSGLLPGPLWGGLLPPVPTNGSRVQPAPRVRPAAHGTCVGLVHARVALLWQASGGDRP